MIWLVIILMILILALLVSIRMNVTGLVNERYWHQVDHAKCIAHIAHYVGNHFAADVLRAAAEDYGTPAAQTELQIISRKQWNQDGPRIPSIWMTNRADALEQEVTS